MILIMLPFINVGLIFVTLVLVGQITYGQIYENGPASLEEQLKLAREKISNAQQQGAYGSGTAMLGASINQTILFIVILVIIFGGVAGAFFAASRGGKRTMSMTDTNYRLSKSENEYRENIKNLTQQLKEMQEKIAMLERK